MDGSQTMEESYEVISDALGRYRMVQKAIKVNKKKPAYKRSSTISNLLKNVKDKYSGHEQTGVCEIPLKNIDTQKKEVYIGATARNLKDRLNEHEDNIKKGLLTTALSRRAYEYEVKIDWNSCESGKKGG